MLPVRGLEGQLETPGLVEPALVIQLVTPQGAPDDLQVFPNTPQRMVELHPVPVGDGGVGDAEPEQEAPARQLVEAGGVKRHAHGCPAQHMIDGRAQFEPCRHRAHRGQHHRRVLVVGLPSPGTVEAAVLRSPGQRGYGVHGELGARVEFDVEFHGEMPSSGEHQGLGLGPEHAGPRYFGLKHQRPAQPFAGLCGPKRISVILSAASGPPHRLGGNSS